MHKPGDGYAPGTSTRDLMSMWGIHLGSRVFQKHPSETLKSDMCIQDVHLCICRATFLYRRVLTKMCYTPHVYPALYSASKGLPSRLPHERALHSSVPAHPSPGVHLISAHCTALYQRMLVQSVAPPTRTAPRFSGTNSVIQAYMVTGAQLVHGFGSRFEWQILLF